MTLLQNAESVVSLKLKPYLAIRKVLGNVIGTLLGRVQNPPLLPLLRVSQSRCGMVGPLLPRIAGAENLRRKPPEKPLTTFVQDKEFVLKVSYLEV